MKRSSSSQPGTSPALPSPWEKAVDFSNSAPIAICLGLFVIAVVLFSTAGPIEDLDIWWHLKTGRWIADHGAVPKTDPFSWLIAGKPWVSFEWLSQLLFYKVWQAGGPLGLFWLREAIACSLFGTLFILGASAPLAAGAIVLFGLSVGGSGILERPQLFTYSFALLYRILAPRAISAEKNSLAAAMGIVAGHCVWANLHGGASVVGLLILGAYGAACLWSGDRPALKRAAILAGLAILGSLVNPHGVKIYTQLFGTWFDPAQRWVLEWKPLTPDSRQFKAYIAYLGLLGLSLFQLRGQRRAVALILAALFGAYFGLRSARNVPLAFFVTCPDLLFAAVSFSREKRKLYAALLIPLALFMTAGYSPLLRWTRPGETSPNPITREWLSGACDFIERRDIPGRMYNDYVIGGYLIWRLTPRRQVFIDGRSLEYGAELMHAIARISRREGFSDLDAAHRFDYLVFQQRQDSRLLYLDDDPDWSCVYFDDGGLIYAHKSRAAGAAARKWGYRLLRPNEPGFDYLKTYASDPARAREVLRELDRAIAESPAWLSANSHLAKGAFLAMSQGDLAWARWMVSVGERFDYSLWRQQLSAAKIILKAP